MLLILDMALNGIRFVQIPDTLRGTDHRAESNVVDQSTAIDVSCYRLMVGGPRFIATVAGRGYRFL